MFNINAGPTSWEKVNLIAVILDGVRGMLQY
jgi:hypothetical protein